VIDRTRTPPTGELDARPVAGILAPLDSGSEGSLGGDAAGLVSYATFRTDEKSVADPEQFFASFFRFPSADMVGVAASMFPGGMPSAVSGTHWRRLSEVHAVGVQEGRNAGAVQFETVDAGIAEYRDFFEGQFPRVEIGPGLVRFARTDLNRADRARARAADTETAERKMNRREHYQLWYGPMALVPDHLTKPPAEAYRTVVAFSRKSRARLRSQIASLDLRPLVSGDSIPGMVTLTLPDNWLEVAPTAKVMAVKFDRFRANYESRWKVKLQCIWKREFQRRGAPHYHLWLVPPVDPSKYGEFRAWLSKTWTGILFKGVKWSYGPGHFDGRKDQRCVCSNYCKSLAAGTGLDFTESLRSRDPNRLAEYFLKEAGHSESKAYQNVAPVQWAGQSIGRFWGVRGIEKALATVDIHPADQYAILRVMRKVRAARSGKIGLTVDRVNVRTGSIQRRVVHRRPRPLGPAGWVAVNDGASFGADLGRWATEVAARRQTASVALSALGVR
jgi:hypothetical protein